MIALIFIAALTLGAATLAFTRRNLIHAALLLVATWGGIAAFYLWAGAEFLGFGQILVYVGAVSMVVLFAVLLTRAGEAPSLQFDRAMFTRLALGLLVGGATFGTLIGAIITQPLPRPAAEPTGEFHIIAFRHEDSVRRLGELLAGPYAAALLIVGVILTATLLGAVVLASSRSDDDGEASGTK